MREIEEEILNIIIILQIAKMVAICNFLLYNKFNYGKYITPAFGWWSAGNE